ncbi:PREDICTED: centromere protein U [Dipodomys ordii]|uniref:Centromere protein U n=1 Tax=Dipodomys ordii TaxID=10020 RepID=A0A1S3FSL7_DIPOR|nr:PREDICTED: centromere protein U [Dipodomys ordii]
MALRWRVRSPRHPGSTENPKNTAGRTHFMKDKAAQEHRPIDTFDFPENSVLSRNEKDEEPYENFDPLFHSTAIYADEEEFGHCASPVPLIPQGKEEKQSSSTTENEASGNESVRVSTRKAVRSLIAYSTFSGNFLYSRSGILGMHHKGNSTYYLVVDRINLPTPDVQTTTICSPQNLALGHSAHSVDASESMHIWCLEGRKASDIMELDIILSAFEKIFLQYKQRIKSAVCEEAVTKFYLNIKEELIRMLKEVQTLKTLKRKNAKVITSIEKKRQRLIEVQDELLRLQPQLKQLQTKYEELKERKSSLSNVLCFLPNLKQLHQDYSDLQEKEPNIRDTF